MDPNTIASRTKKNEAIKEKQLTAQRHTEQVNSFDGLAQQNLAIMQSFVKYLNGRVSKTEITNQLESIATPDALKLVPLLVKIDKTIKDSTIDWNPVTEALKPIADELGKLTSKKDPEAIEIPEIDYQKMADAFSGAISRLSAPIVNVAAPVVEVPKADAPIIHTEKVDLKPFVSEVLQVLTDFRVWTQDQLPEPIDFNEFEELLKKNNDWLSKIEKKTGGSAGGGGGMVSFKNPEGSSVQAELTGDGLVRTLESSGLVPAVYDSITLTYVGTTDKIAIVVYKRAAVTVATLTLGYDGSDRLNSVVKA